MPAAADLMADPVGFMGENIVIVTMQGDLSNPIFNGVVNLKLWTRPRAVLRGRKRNWRNSRVGVYYLQPHVAPVYYPDAVIDNTQIPAYFCPYNGNATYGTVVAGGADLAFTTQMDGCSFGVGSATATGDRLVFHANTAAPTPGAQANAQDQQLRTAFQGQNTQIATIWGPADYRVSRGGTSYKATTFGVRTPGANGGAHIWRFYSQRYTLDTQGPPQVFSLKEVAYVG